MQDNSGGNLKSFNRPPPLSWSFNPPQQYRLSGWAWKSSAQSTAWKRRYCNFEGDELVYYKEPLRIREGAISLDSIQVNVLDKHKGRSNVVAINTPGQVYYLSPEDSSDVWADAIQTVARFFDTLPLEYFSDCALISPLPAFDRPTPLPLSIRDLPPLTLSNLEVSSASPINPLSVASPRDDSYSPRNQGLSSQQPSFTSNSSSPRTRSTSEGIPLRQSSPRHLAPSPLEFQRHSAEGSLNKRFDSSRDQLSLRLTNSASQARISGENGDFGDAVLTPTLRISEPDQRVDSSDVTSTPRSRRHSHSTHLNSSSKSSSRTPSPRGSPRSQPLLESETEPSSSSNNDDNHS